MKQDIVREALNNIHQKKRLAEENYSAKMQKVYEDEKYAELSKQHTKLMIENAKLESLGEKPDIAAEKKLKEQMATIEKKYNLENHTPAYSCKLCKDEGYKNGTQCKCLKQEISKVLLKESGFEKLEKFKDAVLTSGDLAPVYKKMQEWCNANSSKNLIYLAGPTGVGKTYLMRCMANEFIENGRVVKIVTAFNMSLDFRDFLKNHNEEILQNYLSCEILFIDDIGTEPIFKNATVEYFYLILNERKMRKLPTILTGNLTMEDIRNRYEERIYSRIADRQTSITLYLDGQDKRLKK